MNIVLNSYGLTLQKENDLFVIYTPDGKQSFPPEKVKSITIGMSARLTSDAILLAIKHQVDILFTDNKGTPQGRVWSVKYGSVSAIRKAQINFLYSGEVIPWVKEILNRKLNNQIALLLYLQPSDPSVLPGYNLVKYAINSIEDYRRKINKSEGAFLSDISASLRGWEGAAGKKYFTTISALLPEAFQFESRSRKPATDVFNAMLNYSYGILYGKVEGSLIKAGIDPYLGIFHRDEYNRPALVYDVIEQYRFWMDYVVVQLAMQQAIPLDCFSYDEVTGACRLESLAKRILIQSVNDYMSEIIEWEGLERSRETHIDLQAQKLSGFFVEAAKSIN